LLWSFQKSKITEEKDKRLVLLEYIGDLNLRDPGLLETKSADILEKAESCLFKYLNLPANNSRRNYYEPAIRLIKDAIKKEILRMNFQQPWTF
jgi:hypothetical protein